ncbi:50S ribosomal protein L11 methyltransferase [Salinicoccus halitifaciens]|uniref:Ribosomal protein L11 methyltransferase n=1 Tax=Salinicoccus halitifaciens TaxID=1073415 RepID=A0ABV2E6P9_9STAP|nr:50S ribosomal protein L11 methyltransferase [Salinicoccus halitifaciens]MCD2136844.1 50S ribosomal protein L11 methyltransferase [Salinicoccus halitifaciens]
MKWHEVAIHTKEDNEESLSAYLNTLSKGVSIEHSIDILRQKITNFDEKFKLNPKDYPDSDIRILVYFDETQDVETMIGKIETFISEADLASKEEIDISHKVIEESDWENEWKKHFHSFRVSETFVIVPSWEMDEYEYRERDRLIKLDPGMAFGTGDHPTTSMCLKFIEKTVKPGSSVIDVGTGSGILSIASHMMGASSVKATDIDELSIKVAYENFVINDCEQAIRLETADLLKEEDGSYDIVIANILAHIIEDMVEDAYEKLNEDGYFIASGIISEKRDEITGKMTRAGFRIVEILEEDGWVSILAEKV